MAKHPYKILSHPGAARLSVDVGQQLEVGEIVELDLPDEQRTAVVAAGWVEPVATRKEK